MGYIGKQPIVGNFQVCDAISVVNGQAAYTMQVNSTNVEPETANHMLVSLNGVLQKPGSSFTISGSTITFASNLATGDVIDFILLLGDVLNIGTPSDNGVTTSSIAANAVTGAKLNTDVISAQTALAAEPADTDEFLISDAGTLKRIDYSYIKGGGSYNLLSTTTITSNTSNVDITSNIDSTYKNYMIKLTDIHPSTDANLRMRVFHSGSIVDGSNTYLYAHTRFRSDGNSNTDAGGGNYNPLSIDDVGGGAAHECFNGELILFNPSGTTHYKVIQEAATNIDELSATNHVTASCTVVSTNAIDGVRFYLASGSIASGVIKLYGIS